MSEAELDMMQNQIIQTEYRNDPMQLRRMLILSELEPYRHLSRAEATDLFKANIISEEDLRIKLNFPNFVRRFERENMNILEFGSELPYERKIAIITEEFRKYASELDSGESNVQQP